MGKDWQKNCFEGTPALKPLGSYLCPNLCSLRHKGNTLQFRAYHLLVEGALELRMSLQPQLRDPHLGTYPPQGPDPQLPPLWPGVKYRAPSMCEKVTPDWDLPWEAI